MPTTCFVPGCRENYRSETKVSLYSFPRDELLKKRWVEAVRRKDSSVSKHSRVCELHFKNTDFETDVSAYDSKTGVTLTVPLVRKRLKKGVIPSLLLPTSDSVSSDDKISSKQVKPLKIGQSTTVQNRLKWVPVLAKNSQLKDTLETISPVSRLPGNREEEESREMVKRKRKPASNETPNKKTSNSSKLNSTHLSNGVQPAQKRADENIQGTIKPKTTNPESLALQEVQVKQEPLSDQETQSNPSRNDHEKTVSENVQITNVKSLSSESIAETPSEEENATRKTDEGFDCNFYSKPLDMDQRDKAFGSFVACELSDLRANPALYMKTKQSILKMLTEAHFEQMSSGKKS